MGLGSLALAWPSASPAPRLPALPNLNPLHAQLQPVTKLKRSLLTPTILLTRKPT